MKSTRGQAAWFALVAAGVLLLGVRESVAQEPLTLEVNRADGSVNILGSAQINGYSISSPSGLLNPETWSSLVDQNVVGWFEANPREQMLSELKPAGNTDVATGLNLGAAYAGTMLAPRDEDVFWTYSNNCPTCGAGEVLDGLVEYTGPINDLVLSVDPETGAGFIELQSANVGTFDVTGYSIFSDSGSLNVDGFTGLGGDWTIANPQATALADLNLTGSQMFSTGTRLGIGTVWTVGGETDLTFEFSTVDGDLLPGTVSLGGGPPPPPLDCNGDGVADINDANCWSDAEWPNQPTELDRNLAAIGSLRGDLDGDGEVQFSDFVELSNNFTQAGEYTNGDFIPGGDSPGVVQFDDFVWLADNFGATAGGVAAAVPEPATGLLALMGIVGLAAMRRARVRVGHCLAACLVLGLFVSATNNSAMARDFDARMVRIGADENNPDITNNEINNTREAIGILNGSVTDVNILEDVSTPVDILDYAGGAGTFSTDNPYPNGVNDDTMIDFTVRVTGALEIPAGDWTIGFNSDDGGVVNLPRATFVATGNENGAATPVPGQIMFNGTRGFSWTYGHFTVPDGETLRTEFEGIMFERGGGDGFEVAIVDGFEDGTGITDFGFELFDGVQIPGRDPWNIIDGPGAGDFNWDDVVDMGDFAVLSDNFGTGSTFAQGDMNGDGTVDLNDFVELVPLLTGTPAGVASVPEPSSLALILAGGLLLAVRRRRR